MSFLWLRNKDKLIIDSPDNMEKAAEYYGILPFFLNKVRGLSVQELCAPGMLFGGNLEEGCWEWKGPVIRRKTSAYGKFFNRKAGFVSMELLPDFLNYRRALLEVKPASTEELLLEIIMENGDITSTELKSYIFGRPQSRRKADEIPDNNFREMHPSPKRKSLEGPLQRLQMGGHIIISDFEYKTTKRGERYGWGVARYSTPEYHFGELLRLPENKTPEESLEDIVSYVKKRYTRLWSDKLLRSILKP